LLPGTELSFAEEVRREGLWPWSNVVIRYRTAIFRQVNKDRPATHHDALEFPDGEVSSDAPEATSASECSAIARDRRWC
jgi:hypothetical protein